MISFLSCRNYAQIVIGAFSALTATIFLAIVFLHWDGFLRSPVNRKVSHTREANPEAMAAAAAKHKREECFLFVVVMSSVESDNRIAVRETWFQDVKSLQPKVRAKFAVGLQGLTDDQLAKLTDEQRVHHDMLLLPDVENGYDHRSRKMLSIVEWIADNVNASYVLKTDDDYYVHIRTLLDELEARKSAIGLYWGHIVKKKPVTSEATERFLKEPSWFLCQKTFIPYALGGGYVLSANVIAKVAHNARILQLYNNEDITMAVWASSFKLERKHDKRFNIDRGPCQSNDTIFHCSDNTPEMMRKFHQHVLEKRTLC